MHAAPTVSSPRFTNPLASACPQTIAAIAPGQLFVISREPLDVLALLTHADVDVTDAKARWCVVVAAKPGSVHKPGSLLPLPADRLVFPVDVLVPASYRAA